MAQLAVTQISVDGGVVVHPYTSWIAWSLGIGLTASPTKLLDIRGGIGIATTKGARCCPPGTGFGVDMGISWSWPLF